MWNVLWTRLEFSNPGLLLLLTGVAAWVSVPGEAAEQQEQPEQQDYKY